MPAIQIEIKQLIFMEGIVSYGKKYFIRRNLRYFTVNQSLFALTQADIQAGYYSQ